MTQPIPILTINDHDARATWGVIADTKLLAALLAPSAVKDPVQSSSRLEHGTRVILPEGAVKLASREIALEVGLTATSLSDFLTRLQRLMNELTAGWIRIASPRYLPGVVFNCRYVSCTQFTSYNGRIAKLILKLEEPNPANRT